ncbi:MAG: hypothetical protein UT08_C0009G0009 [Candidatus Woesebacteria bacterium GW2011_GWB1_38_8]|uniref:Recombinase domain-containing protein n=1 Tax=Candidatus Woesebacteria bacterium GW2011_GWB1_38_8 TaxID=1618570 RepID=A0A0G0LBF2_9BACT|nr:MAG: hypothetical protein UT08_C0009G0009 [Candidatus Woesebacteria bacterium GW2011_GWB1_38_8]KKR30080.1 MAG: Mg chelatase, subunit ChlI, magnesium chelatase family protein [Parcubacteria group bacterium GW2011_GWC1_39_8]
MEMLTNGELKIERKLPEVLPLRFVVYARTSTVAQAEEDKISIPDQIKWGKDLCAQREWEYCGEYIDTLPGDVEFEQREGGFKLLEDAKFNLFDLAGFYHSSRLAREPWMGLKTIDILGKLRKQVYIRNNPLEPTPPHLFVHGSNVAAEYMNAFSLVGDKQENIARSERVTSGFKNLAQRGVLVFAPYGLKKVAKIKTTPDGKQKYTWYFEPDPVKEVIVIRSYTEYDGGKSLRKICFGLIQDKIPSPTGKIGLGSWSPATIKNILSDPAYIKKVKWGRKLGSKYRQGKSYSGKQKRVFTSQDKWILEDANNVTRAIIDETQFNRVQERLRQRSKVAGRQLSSDSPLAGLVWCGECNKRAYLKTRRVKKDGHIYIRSDFIDSSYFRGLGCRRHLMSADKLEHLVLTKLQLRLNELQETDIDNEMSLREETAKTMLAGKLGQLDRQIRTYESKQSRLMELYLSASIDRDGFNKQKTKLDNEMTVLVQERTRIQGIINDQRKQREALKTLKQLLNMFVKITDSVIRKEKIHRIIDNLVIYQDHVDIIYKYGEPIDGLNVNPHPCGYYGDPKKACKCMPGMILRYQKRVSGPILDRIDIHISLRLLETDKLVGNKEKAESSRSIQARVQKARDIQIKRFKGSKFKSNSEMSSKAVKQFCPLSPECLAILRSAVATMNLTARSYHKVIKVARTIADLEGAKDITTNHIAEALQYRPQNDDEI